ncbi:unnamed protein product, partial [Chrysoparadoxa australica]
MERPMMERDLNIGAEEEPGKGVKRAMMLPPTVETKGLLGTLGKKRERPMSMGGRMAPRPGSFRGTPSNEQDPASSRPASFRAGGTPRKEKAPASS